MISGRPATSSERMRARRCKRHTLPVAICMFLLLLIAACGRSKDAVARIGDETITVPQWQAFAGSAPVAGPSTQSLRDRLVTREVAWIQATRQGLLATPAWKAAEARIEQDALISSYLAGGKQLSAFTEADAKTFFTAHNTRRRVSHVLCTTEADAQAALARLTKGEPFEKVARAVSKDPGAIHGGGDLGWISREQVVKPFGDAAFAAKEGELVGPVKTEFGWHVLVVRGIQAPTDQDFERDKAVIMAKMETMRQQQQRQAALAPLKAKYPTEPDQAVLERDRTTVVMPGDETLVAGRVAGQTISLKQLKEYLALYIKTSGQSHSLGATTKAQFLDMLADDVRLRAAALEAGVDKSPTMRAAYWNALHEAGAAAFVSDYLARYEPSARDLQAYYDAHREAFAGPGAVRLNVLVTEQREFAEAAIAGAGKGTDWASLVGSYANKESTGNWDLGWVEMASLQGMLPSDGMKALAECPVGAVVGPIPGPEGFEVFQVLGRKPGPLEPFGKCRDRVKGEFLRIEGQSLVDRFLEGPGREGLTIEWYLAG